MNLSVVHFFMIPFFYLLFLFYPTIFMIVFTSHIGRLCLLIYIMISAQQHIGQGLILAMLFMMIQLYYIIQATPNIITANSATFLQIPFQDQYKLVLDKRIQYENSYFVKPFQYPLGKRPEVTNRISPFGS